MIQVQAIFVSIIGIRHATRDCYY